MNGEDAFYFAPMEGITAYPLRRAHHDFFSGLDAYYIPFIDTHQTKTLKTKEKKEIDPANNEGFTAVPQLLSKNAGLFVWYAMKLRETGYEEVNLNLGCPSKTVVPKGKGAGFLRDLDAVDAFLEEVFNELGNTNIRISVKTRTGMDEEEPRRIAEILNRYPLDKVIVHPRMGKMFYEGVPDLDAFEIFLETSIHPVTYNGDLRTAEDYRRLRMRFPELHSFMIGRGLLMNPGCVREMKGAEHPSREKLLAYADQVMKNWMEDLADERQVLGRMKEFWYYFISSFSDKKSALTRLRKSKTLSEFNRIVSSLS